MSKKKSFAGANVMPGRQGAIARTLVERFWEKVDRTGGLDACWPWLAAKINTGSGVMQMAKNSKMAHRISWELANGRELTDEEFVCHTCDNRECVNPAHLWIGTNQENMQDMSAKGRANPPRGPKLTDDQVRQVRRMRSDGLTLETIAAHFGASFQGIHNIVTGRRRSGVS